MSYAALTRRHTPVCHANQQDVVQGVHAIDLGEQLVDHGVVDPAAAGDAAALLADGVYLVKDDDMQIRGVTLLRLLNLCVLQRPERTSYQSWHAAV